MMGWRGPLAWLRRQRPPPLPPPPRTVLALVPSDRAQRDMLRARLAACRAYLEAVHAAHPHR